MRRRTVVIGLGVLIFFVGVIVIAVSTWSTPGFIEYKVTLATYPTPPATGEDIPPSIIVGPFEGGRAGVNISGSFECYPGARLFWVRDMRFNLICIGPSFPAVSNITEFNIYPGDYRITFNVTFRDNSHVEVYEYRSVQAIVYPYKNLYSAGVFLSVTGIVTTAVATFMPSRDHAKSQRELKTRCKKCGDRPATGPNGLCDQCRYDAVLKEMHEDAK